MSSGPRRWHVIVLDDRKEFALHVWRYLNRSLGIGIGPRGSSGDTWMPEGVPIPFLNGGNNFCWLRADGQWSENLSRHLAHVANGWNLLAVIDVVGEPGYDPHKVMTFLEQWRRHRADALECLFVSAYHAAPTFGGQQVLPKTRDTLKTIWRTLYAGLRPQVSQAPPLPHILITGAGFEIRNDRGGFGMPFTSDLLAQMKFPFEFSATGEVGSDRGITYLAFKPGEEGRSFPCPIGEPWDNTKSLQNAAADRKLDRYWDILLARGLQSKLFEVLHMDDPQREEVTAKALLAERQMREAFRRAVAEHDWGHLNQSVDAAGLIWHAWFTTNYTRFADRAITLLEPLEWRIISTAAEATTSIREDDWSLKNPERGGRRFRYLFKLHGDVGHLHTMAVAGHDKDIFSPLSVPMDDLYQVYASAERFLRFSLRKLPVVVWHIVGHALGDSKLLDLISQACEQRKGEHIFLIADPKSQAVKGNLKAALGSRSKIHARDLKAEEYMARLAFSGLPLSSSSNELQSWFQDLP